MRERAHEDLHPSRHRTAEPAWTDDPHEIVPESAPVWFRESWRVWLWFLERTWWVNHFLAQVLILFLLGLRNEYV